MTRRSFRPDPDKEHSLPNPYQLNNPKNNTDTYRRRYLRSVAGDRIDNILWCMQEIAEMPFAKDPSKGGRYEYLSEGGRINDFDAATIMEYLNNYCDRVHDALVKGHRPQQNWRYMEWHPKRLPGHGNAPKRREYGADLGDRDAQGD